MKTIDYFEKIGYPTRALMLDFESYFDDKVGFGSQSTIEYITDPQWETLGCGFRWIDEGEDKTWWVDGPELKDMFHCLQMQYGMDLEGCTVVAKNCKFDVTLMQHHYDVMPKYTVDLDDLLRFYDARMSHKLKDVCKMLKLPPKGDTFKFKGMHFDDIKNHENPEVYDKFLVEYTHSDVNRQCDILDWVFPLVDFSKEEAFMARHTLELYIYPRFRIDFAHALKVQMGMKHQLKKVCRRYDSKLLGSSIQLGTELGVMLEAHGHKLPLKEKTKRNKKGKIPETKGNLLKVIEQYGEEIPGVPLWKCSPSFAKDDDGCKWMQAHTDAAIRDLIEARIGIKSWPTHISKVTGIVNQAKCNESNMLRVPIVYYGAHTGRWTGNEKINLLNMGSGGRGRKQHPIISQTRGCLLPPKDRKLLIYDSAQIEARELAWMAGQNDLIKDFAEELDPYSVLARDIFQTDNVWKWSDDDVHEHEMFPDMTAADFKAFKTMVKLYRGFGKDAILGAGYGMGWATFLARCLQNPFLRPYFDSGEYDAEFVKKIIKTYRRKYRRIVNFWDTIQKKWKAATAYKGQVISLNIPDSPSSLKFFHEAGTTYIRLPSGRHLRYRNARITKDGDLKWRWGTLWGGVITENVDQAISRDLLTFWIQMAEEDKNYDFNVNLHTYDELVSDVPDTDGPEHQARMHEIMCTCPDWAQGMPLGAEGGLAERYKK